MGANHITFATLNDIIFEGRNKAYGAYQLRQDYDKHVKKALVITLSTVVLLMAGSYAAIEMRPDFIVPPKVNEGVVIDLQVDPIFEKEFEQPKEAKVAPAASSAPTTKFLTVKIVENEVPVKENIPEQGSFTAADPGLTTTEGTPGGTNLPAENLGNGSGTEIVETTTEPFIWVENMPEYEDGGTAGMNKFISRNLKYPPSALRNGLEGNVIISFVINPAGEISDLKVLKDIGGGTAEEAMRVISKMPKWKPGIQNHRPVPVRMTLPIRFSLN